MSRSVKQALSLKIRIIILLQIKEEYVSVKLIDAQKRGLSTFNNVNKKKHQMLNLYIKLNDIWHYASNIIPIYTRA